MREIIDITFTSPLSATCVFNDKTIKHISLETIAKSPVFSFLNDTTHINFLINKGYYIEWPLYEADLSADTLWHLEINYA